MRTVWTSKIRPSLCLRSPANLESLLARQTTSLPRRNGLQFADAFLLLLAPILTTALVADLSWKDRCRKEWEIKIAEVIEEVERLRASEREAWTALQRRSVRLGAAIQRRSYATATLATAAESEDDEETLHLSRDEDNVQDRDVPRNQGDPNPSKENAEMAQSPNYTAHNRQKALKMALKMRLHVHLGQSYRFRENYEEPSGYPTDLNALASDLRQIEHRLKSLQMTEAPKVDARSSLDMAQKSRQLDDRLTQLATEYRLGRTSFPRYIDCISDEIVRSTAFPSVDGYITLLRSICEAGFDVGTDSLAYLVLPNLGPRHDRLNRNAILSVLTLFARNRDLHHLDSFLQDLVRNSHLMPENERWEWRVLNGVQVPAPTKPDRWLVQRLVFTALHCDQPHRAAAWMMLLNKDNAEHHPASYFVKSFLRYYCQSKDWGKGRIWLKRACNFGPSIARQGLSNMQHVVFRMLEFCVACGKQETYAKILHAAVESGLGVYEAKPDRLARYSPRSQDILSEWGQLYRSRPGYDPATQSDSQRARRALHFRDLLAEEMKSLDSSNKVGRRPRLRRKIARIALDRSAQDVTSDNFATDDATDNTQTPQPVWQEPASNGLSEVPSHPTQPAKEFQPDLIRRHVLWIKRVFTGPRLDSSQNTSHLSAIKSPNTRQDRTTPEDATTKPRLTLTTPGLPGSSDSRSGRQHHQIQEVQGSIVATQRPTAQEPAAVRLMKVVPLHQREEETRAQSTKPSTSSQTVDQAALVLRQKNRIRTQNGQSMPAPITEFQIKRVKSAASSETREKELFHKVRSLRPGEQDQKMPEPGLRQQVVFLLRPGGGVSHAHA